MLVVFEAGFMVVKTGFEIGFSHTDIFFLFVKILSLDSGFVNDGTISTFTI